MCSIAYQGEPGAYSEQAAMQFFGNAKDTTYYPCTSFREMFEAVQQGTVQRAAVPSENSLAGTIHENLDLLLRFKDLTVVGELDFRVRHCLLATRGVKITDIKTVRSHPMALAQCPTFLQASGLTPELAYDTAGSAKLIHKTNATDCAAIASKRAAEIYDLEVLAEGIEDEKENYTRFLIISKEKVPYKIGAPSKTSIAFSLLNGPGQLFKALSVFAVTDVDLTRIESRHIHTVLDAVNDHKDENVERRWGYVFYVDFSRHTEERSVAKALDHLQEITTFFRILGSYPSHCRDLHD